MARKKKRSAKQLANDRRLGRMAKARAKKKRGGRRKVAKKNPHRYGITPKGRAKVAKIKAAKRKVSAKSHLWLIFKVSKYGVLYLSNPTLGKSMFRPSKTDAVLMQSKASGQAIARAAARKMTTKGSVIGTTQYSTTEREIKKSVEGK